MQKHVNLVDLVKSFPTNIFLQNHPDVAAVLNVAKPVAQLDAHPVSSTTK